MVIAGLKCAPETCTSAQIRIANVTPRTRAMPISPELPAPEERRLASVQIAPMEKNTRKNVPINSASSFCQMRYMFLPEAQPDCSKPAEASRPAILAGWREIPKRVERACHWQGQDAAVD